MNAADLSTLRDVMQEKCIRKGGFILASGIPANYYYDGKQATLRPEAARIIGRLVLDLVRETGAEAVGGMAIGADPIAQSVALASLDDGGSKLPAFIVRAAAKDHGTREQTSSGYASDAEPLLRPGRRVAIVDDVITTGGSVQAAMDVVEGLGCEVVGIIVLVERHERGGERLRERGYTFRRLFYTNVDGDLLIDEQLLQRAAAADRARVLR